MIHRRKLPTVTTPPSLYGGSEIGRNKQDTVIVANLSIEEGDKNEGDKRCEAMCQTISSF